MLRLFRVPEPDPAGFFQFHDVQQAYHDVEHALFPQCRYSLLHHEIAPGSGLLLLFHLHIRHSLRRLGKWL